MNGNIREAIFIYVLCEEHGMDIKEFDWIMMLVLFRALRDFERWDEKYRNEYFQFANPFKEKDINMENFYEWLKNIILNYYGK